MFTVVALIFRINAISSIVNTIYGPVEGNITSMGRTFTGIPFASPPIGNLRWMAPIPPNSWTNPLKATQLPPQCPQSCDDPTSTYWCAPTTSEDCLYLNIWTPLNVTTSSSLPVLLWIYGGGFVVGYSGGIQKNGTIMSNFTNTIIVSINYRVGAMGFYYNKHLNILGNFGYLDQVAAIEFIYKNIQFFGGDPNRITIYGESAGAHSVAMHLLNTTSLINSAIIESIFAGSALMTTNEFDSYQSNAFITACGCDINKNIEKQIECMKNLSWELIVNKQNEFPWGPVVNTTLFPIDPLFEFQRGQFKNIPFIIGMNLGEYYYMMGGITDVTYEQLYQKLSNDIGKQNTKLVLDFYNCTNKPNGYNFINETAEIFTDLNVKCPSRNITASQAIYGKKNEIYSYFYHFSHVSSFIKNEPGCNSLCEYAPCHTTEIPYVFKDNLTPIGIEFDKDEILLADQFQFYWSNMAANLNPNIGFNVNVNWTSYSNEKRDILYFDVGDKMKINTGADQNVCDFWDSLNYNWLFSG